MSQSGFGYIDQTARSNWIKLRTLVMVRWFAIAGQTLAVLVAYFALELKIPFELCALVILFSILVNVLGSTIYPDNKRLSENEAVTLLLFDIIQLGFLLFLTGGINNPFALLVLAPVTVAASALSKRLVILLGLMAVLLVTVVSFFYIPLETSVGGILEMPLIFAFGFWLSIVVGLTFIAVYTGRVTAEISSMAEALLATQMALAREQKLTDLGGVVAATAHELGTPLATIKLVSSELMEELENQEELKSDALLIREQANRCADILRSMGQAGKDDTHLKFSLLKAVVEEAAEPHLNRGKTVSFEIDELSVGPHPIILRQPEFIHGMRNIIQNAVDFSDQSVKVSLIWTQTKIEISVSDDGPGYPAQVINKLGDPFVRQRTVTQNENSRPAYEGMGLGLFIAKTLLERSGAIISFENQQSNGLSGAVVTMSWPRERLEAKPEKGSVNPVFPIR